MDYIPRKSLSKYLITDKIDFNKHVHNIITDKIDFNKHVHDVDIFINDKWRIYAGSDIGRLVEITRRLELRF